MAVAAVVTDRAALGWVAIGLLAGAFVARLLLRGRPPADPSDSAEDGGTDGAGT